MKLNETSGICLTVAVSVTLILLALFTLLYAANNRGNDLRERKEECYARGSSYHYWQEREWCVVRVPTDKELQR